MRTRAGLVAGSRSPRLTWPSTLLPQQYVSLPLLAQACPPPALRAETRERPLTRAGTVRFVVVPSPSWPPLFDPQHHTLESRPRAQLKKPPATIVLNGVPLLTMRGVDDWAIPPEP